MDKQGRTVDFLLSERRDISAAKRFFRNAIKNNGIPRVVTLDAYAASHRAIAELKSVGTVPRRVRIRSSKYLNNVVEQDHRRIKQRIRPMLGFKRFDTAAVTITGIELAQKIKKHQFKIGKLSTVLPPTEPAIAPLTSAALSIEFVSNTTAASSDPITQLRAPIHARCSVVCDLYPLPELARFVRWCSWLRHPKASSRCNEPASKSLMSMHCTPASA